MSDQREELALRRWLEERRPLAIPVGLSARLDRIPLEVPQRPSAPKRAALAVAPWAALLAAGLVLAFGPLAVTGPAADPGAGPAQPWDPVAAAPSYNDVGVFGLPWVPALVVLGLAGLAWTVWRLATRRPLRPAVRASLARLRRDNDGWGQVIAFAFVVFGSVVLMAGPLLSGGSTRDDGPLVITSYAPGQGVSEVRQDGSIVGNDGGWGPDEPPGKERYVYRVAPMDRFTFVFVVRNSGFVPVTFLGAFAGDGSLPTKLQSAAPYALVAFGLPADPAHPTGLLADTVPFQPVEIPAGGEVAVVAGYVAGQCADPNGPLLPRVNDGYWDGTRFTYEMLGWRQVQRLPWNLDVTVTTAPGSTCTDRF